MLHSGQNRDSTQFTSTLGNIVIIVNSIAAAIDFLIAGAMIYLLIGRHKSKIARYVMDLTSVLILLTPSWVERTIFCGALCVL